MLAKNMEKLRRRQMRRPVGRPVRFTPKTAYSRKRSRQRTV